MSIHCYFHNICQDEDVRAAVEKDFIKGFIAQHGSKIKVPDEYAGFKFPLHVLTNRHIIRGAMWILF